MVWQGSALSSPWAFLLLRLHFFSLLSGGEWPLTALGCKCFVPPWGRRRGQALGLPLPLWLEPLQRRRTNFIILRGATLPPT